VTFKLQPKWIVISGCLLAFLSSAVNAGFLIRLGTSVSHLTGDVSKVAVDGLEGGSKAIAEAIRLGIAATSFVTGAVIAGFFIHHPGLSLERPYGRSITTIGLSLFAAHFALESHPWAAVGLAGFAFGLQNSLATHYRGMILRTTHLTGLLTDFGVNLGMRLKGHDIPLWKLAVPGSLIVSFFSGAAVGGMMILWWELPFALLISGVYLAGGVGWTAFKHLVLRPRADRK
jgi:uncharacterized membrane protein YoaK (UPF0700 family)